VNSLKEQTNTYEECILSIRIAEYKYGEYKYMCNKLVTDMAIEFMQDDPLCSIPKKYLLNEDE